MLARSAAAAAGTQSTLLLSPVKPGQIIKFEGQSIVGGKSNNNATATGGGQAGAAAAGEASSFDGDDDDNGFKITPDYIQDCE